MMLPGIKPTLFGAKVRKKVVLTTVGAGNWTVPDDWSNSDNSIECIGGGAGGLGGTNGQSGGGGGAYAKSVNLTLTPGASVTVQVGAGGAGKTNTTGNPGGDTWFNSAAFPSSGQACGAKGSPAAVRNAVSPGGSAASSYATGTGSLKYSGGSGGAGVDTTNNCGAGGGGAAGPNGNGANGFTAGSPGGGGGGNGGGANSTGLNGGNNSLGTGGGIAVIGSTGVPGTLGGGGAGGSNTGAVSTGGAGGDGIDLDGVVGGGGGGGGGFVPSTVSAAAQGGNGGLYGAGGGGSGQRLSGTGTGGNGAQGIIVIKYASTVNPPTLGNDAFTVLLLHADGANNSTAFTDSSAAAHVVNKGSSGGNPVISTDTGKFSQSIKLNGTSDFLQSANSADWEFGSGDFTVDWWEYRTSTSIQRPVLARNITGTYAGWLFGYAQAGPVANAYITSNGSSWDIANGQSMGTVVANEWHHRAITRAGNTFRTFYDGVQQATWTSSATIQAQSSALTIGYGQQNMTPSPFVGYIDELRISKGIARWTANFTPPTAPYS